MGSRPPEYGASLFSGSVAAGTSGAASSTGVVLAVVVDMARLVVYGFDLAGQAHRIDWPLVAAASGAAFAGAYGGKRLLKKMTFRSVQWIVSAFLVVVAVGLMSGLL